MRAGFVLSMLSLLSLTGCNSSGGSTDAGSPTAAAPVSSETPFWSIKNSGGAGTSLDPLATSHAFKYPMPNLSHAELALHIAGDAQFERQFSNDPFAADYGLGPVQNNTSCVSCHNRDGRGSLPTGLNTQTWQKLGVNEAIFLRTSIENDDILNALPTEANSFGAPRAVPGFTTQVFHTGAYALRPLSPGDGQAEVWVKLEKSIFRYPDGRIVELSKPLFEVRNPYDAWIDAVSGAKKSRLFDDDVRFSPRMGVPMFGLGLLESIPEKDIIAYAQIDRSSEGVYGKPNMVLDVVKQRSGHVYPVSLGRFGLKANAPNVEQQAMAALNGDLGVTNYLFPDESIQGTALFDTFLSIHPVPLKLETDQKTSASLVFYSKSLAVPPRRNIDLPDVVAGAQLFEKSRCVSCHLPTWKTGATDFSAAAYQEIAPYTDLLLHDMGEGLADGRQDFQATGRQWKTRPLWGVGLTKVVNPRAGYLHDGRAATLEEAILWHDGEAHYAKQRFIHLKKSERDQILQFLQSL